MTALLGANGAGKTTLLSLAAGLLQPSEGQVSCAGGANPGRVGYLPQDFAGPRGVPVGRYLEYVAWCRSSRRAAITRRDVLEAASLVGLSDRLPDRIGTLSGGMVRRLGIAQALLGRSDVLLLDEPTVGLDPVQRRELRRLITELGQRRVVMLSTHLSEDVAAVADLAIVLDQGQIAFAGSVADLCQRGDSPAVSGEGVESGFMAVTGMSAP